MLCTDTLRETRVPATGESAVPPPTHRERERETRVSPADARAVRFNLTKFVSNDTNILQQIERNSECQPNDGKQLPTSEESSHVLGLEWNHDSDTLVVSRGTSPDTNRTVTQRVVPSLVSSVYHPSGLVAPYTVKARLLLKTYGD